jgi:hypothetical protein
MGTQGTPILGEQIEQPARVYPGNSIYVDDQDQLLIRLYSSLSGGVFKCLVRVLTDSGDLRTGEYLLTSSADRSKQETRISIPAGYLIGVSVFASTGTPRRGQTWCVMALERKTPSGLYLVQPFGQNYVTSDSACFFPGPNAHDSIEGPGFIRDIAGTSPAAGAEINETCPTGARWRLYAVYLHLTTAVAAANRIVAIQINSGSTQPYLLENGTVQTASLSWYYAFANGLVIANPIPTVYNAAFPSQVLMMAGDKLVTASTALQAADQYGMPWYQVEEWIEA